MKYMRIFLVLLLLQSMMFPLSVYSQEEEGEVTKYTARDYLDANLPPQEGRRIVLDEITGLLTITDTPKNQELALRLIREWDVGPKQVQIEAKFIEITFTDLNEMGVDWTTWREADPTMGHVASLASPNVLMGAAEAAAFGQAANPAGLGFFIGKASMTGSQLFAYLKALQESGKVNLIHAPRITTLSGQMANMQVVRTFPYAISYERTQVDLTGSIEGQNELIYPVEIYKCEEEIVGVALEVTPTVAEGGNIVTMDIHPEVTKLSQQVSLSSLTAINSAASLFPSNLGWPIIDTRAAQTTVMVRSGETIILGGLIQDADENTVDRKIPILGDIPLVGGLFKYKYEKREKKNLVIFLTARLIDTDGKEIR
jgi:general secretion pathway protein D